MKEYAVWKGYPVVAKQAYFTPRDEHGRPNADPIAIGVSVRLPFGHEQFARFDDLEPIKEEEYHKKVKDFKSEHESKREGIGSCEFLAFKKHGTGAAQSR